MAKRTLQVAAAVKVGISLDLNFFQSPFQHEFETHYGNKFQQFALRDKLFCFLFHSSDSYSLEANLKTLFLLLLYTQSNIIMLYGHNHNRIYEIRGMNEILLYKNISLILFSIRAHRLLLVER